MGPDGIFSCDPERPISQVRDDAVFRQPSGYVSFTKAAMQVILGKLSRTVNLTGTLDCRQDDLPNVSEDGSITCLAEGANIP